MAIAGDLMKRLLAVALAVITLLSLLVGCGEKNTPFHKAQRKAVEIGEKFLDYEITAREAYDLLDDMVLPEEGTSALMLSVYITSLKIELMDLDCSYEDVEEKVKDIKEIEYYD